MPPIPSESILQVTIDGRHENQQVLNVLTYKLLSEGQLPDGDAAINAFWIKFAAVDGMLDKYCACCSQKLTTINVRLQWIYQTRYAFRTKVDENFSQGQVTGNAYPVNTSIAITKRTNLSGRDQVGTLHMPAVPIDFMTNGALLGSAVVKYTAFADQMLQPIVTTTPAATYRPVLYKRSSPSNVIDITAHEVARFARIMRRRTVGLGS